MAKGLDVGTMNIISSREDEENNEIVYVQQRNSFMELDSSEIAERMMNRSDVLHIRDDDGTVYVVGDDALEFANVFNKETRRPMQHGILSSDEKSAIPMMKLIAENVVGDPEHPGERLYYSSPADPIDSDLNTLYHEKTVGSMLEDQGYDAEPINEAMAVIYSELEDRNFTGLGISFGAGMTNICLSYYAVPVTTFSIARGGDWIDEQAASATGEPVNRVTAKKEDDFSLSFETEVGGVEGALNIYYNNLVEYVVDNLIGQINEEDIEEGLDVPVVVTGGTSQPRGFTDLIERRFEEADVPFSISGVQKADDPLYSVSRGALVAAQSEDADDNGGSSGSAEFDD